MSSFVVTPHSLTTCAMLSGVRLADIAHICGLLIGVLHKSLAIVGMFFLLAEFENFIYHRGLQFDL